MRFVTVTPPPDLDLATADAFGRELRALDPTSTVIVDCSSVEFVDSTGLTAMVTARSRQRASGGELRIANPSQQVVRLLELTDLLSMLEPAESPRRHRPGVTAGATTSRPGGAPV
jgi:anti-sigma B factor antagonist